LPTKHLLKERRRLKMALEEVVVERRWSVEEEGGGAVCKAVT